MGILIWLAVSAPHAGRACAVCAGNSDAPMAAGLNGGILGLLAVVLVVLGWIVGFFVYLARRAAREASAPDTGTGWESS